MSEEVSVEPGKASLRCINRDMLKYMAMFLMITGHMIVYLGIDHFKDIVPVPVLRFFVFAEMFAPPVFFFFISEGYRYTRSRKKYALRLLIIALITQVPFYFCHYYEEPLWKILTSWNVMLTLLAGLVVLMVWESKWKTAVRIIVMIAITGFTVLIESEWLGFGPAVVFFLYILRERPVLRLVVFEALMLLHQFIMNGFCFVFAWGAWGFFLAETAAMIVITFLYNGKKDILFSIQE